MRTAQQRARANIDALLTAAGSAAHDFSAINIHANRGVAIREFPLESGHGFADFLLYIDGQASGAIKAKGEDTVLFGVET